MAALGVVGKVPAQLLESIVQARRGLRTIEWIELRVRPPAGDEIHRGVRGDTAWRHALDVIERIMERQAVAHGVVDAGPCECAARCARELRGLERASLGLRLGRAVGPLLQRDRARSVRLEHPAAYVRRVRTQRSDDAEHDPAIGQRRQCEAVGCAAGRVGDLSAQQRIRWCPVQVHTRRPFHALVERLGHLLWILAVRPRERERQTDETLPALRLHVQRLHVDRNEHARLAQQSGVPRCNLGGVESDTNETRPARGLERARDRVRRQGAHRMTSEKRTSRFFSVYATVGRNTASIGCGAVTLGSPNTCRYGKRIIWSANSAPSSALPMLVPGVFRNSSAVFRMSITPGAPARKCTRMSRCGSRSRPVEALRAGTKARNVLAPPAESSRTPNCTPWRGSSMCTTAGTPSNSARSTAGARRSRRSSLSRSGCPSSTISSSPTTSLRYARTCSPGQPETARERRRKPVTWPARPTRAPSLPGTRTIRSSSSISSRIAG